MIVFRELLASHIHHATFMYMPITRDPNSYLIFINYMRSLVFIGTVLWSTMISAIKTMFGPSLPSLVCRRAHVLFMLFVLGMHSDVQHVLTI
jgi:hypothetical protein